MTVSLGALGDLDGFHVGTETRSVGLVLGLLHVQAETKLTVVPRVATMPTGLGGASGPSDGSIHHGVTLL